MEHSELHKEAIIIEESADNKGHQSSESETLGSKSYASENMNSGEDPAIKIRAKCSEKSIENVPDAGARVKAAGPSGRWEGKAPSNPSHVTASQRLREKRLRWGAALRRDMALLLSQQPTAAQAVRCHLFLEVLPTCEEPQDPMVPGDRNRIENLLHDNIMIYREN